jgi:signal transduction histidine kinase
MKEHNGTVEAANTAEGGAVFTVTLPAAGVN